MRASWDIFCNVIDNFGDIGVAWRLARGLVGHGIAVRLWVDDLQAFQRIWPAVNAQADEQRCEGVMICTWRVPFPDARPAQVVIEAFGCTLPESYLLAMSAQSPPPVWINLEYLSAEPWVATHHGLPSPHPHLLLTKYFFFPGYTSDTGGLLIEPDLAARRAAFVEASSLPAFWRPFDLPQRHANELRVSLFAYENPALPALLDAWAADLHPVTCLVPEGRIVPQVAEWLTVSSLKAGDLHQRGALCVKILPFTDQDAYDHLLWACDLNFVRGEDSCVRAQWAARPMVWQAYPQHERAHWDKLDALLATYTAGLDEAGARAVDELWRSWNGMRGSADLSACWSAWRAHWGTLEQHAATLPERLGEAGRLTDKLVEFAENKLK